MVSIFGKILPLAAAGLAIFFLGNAIFRPAQARLTGQALTETGVGLGSSLTSIGGGIGSLLGNIGTGSAQLLNPLFSLRDLVGGNAETNQVAQSLNSSNVTFEVPIPNSAASGPLTTPEREGQTTQRVIEFGSGARTTLPLSQAAIDYYRSIGVSVQ